MLISRFLLPNHLNAVRLLQDGYPVLPIILILVMVGIAILCILAVRFPAKVVQISGRFQRAQTEAMFGPDWERVLQEKGQLRELEYMRRAPDDPEYYEDDFDSIRLRYGCAAAFALFMALFILYLLASNLGWAFCL